jgi:hypothetical protein
MRRRVPELVGMASDAPFDSITPLNPWPKHPALANLEGVIIRSLTDAGRRLLRQAFEGIGSDRMLGRIARHTGLTPEDL